MKKRILVLIWILLLIVCLCVLCMSMRIYDDASGTFELFDFSGILRLKNGQIEQLDPNEGWVCANDEIRKICWEDTGTHDDVIVDPNYAIVLEDAFMEIETTGISIVDADSEEYIKTLAASGRICEVMGHQWEQIDNPLKWKVDLDEMNIVLNYQECKFCGPARTIKWIID